MPELRGYTWWCGDEVCDCTQPVVERSTSASWGQKWERVWEGSFRSGYLEDRERDEQERELREACARLGAVNLDET